ncbi:MAG: hypothetical protein ACYSTJ_05855 [Planctomycetota bacterium]|jgi:hypothetical protein
MKGDKIPKYLLMIITLCVFVPIVGCRLPADNACHAALYAIELDPDTPDVYHSKLHLRINETSGKNSGWKRWWTRTFGGEDEYRARFGVPEKTHDADEIAQIAQRIKNTQ